MMDFLRMERGWGISNDGLLTALFYHFGFPLGVGLRVLSLTIISALFGFMLELFSIEEMHVHTGVFLISFLYIFLSILLLIFCILHFFL